MYSFFDCELPTRTTAPVIEYFHFQLMEYLTDACYFILNGKQTKYTSLFSTISRIPTTLKYLPLFSVSVGSTVEIIPENLSFHEIVLGDSCPSDGFNYSWG